MNHSVYAASTAPMPAAQTLAPQMQNAATAFERARLL